MEPTAQQGGEEPKGLVPNAMVDPGLLPSNVTAMRLVVLANASLPMLVTEAGIVTEVSLLQ